MRFLPLLLLFLACTGVRAQIDLPEEVKITADGRLVAGGNPTEGLYDPAIVNKIELQLDEPNWFALLDGDRRTDGIPLVGRLIFNDDLLLDSVIISIKGETSDFRNRSEKKSFSVKIDDLRDQELMGYDNLNLNCAFEDFSSMREVLYYDISRDFTTALKGNFVDLYINGQYWGPYNNIQQLEGTFIQEWFTNNDGTRWRAQIPDEFRTGTGGNFGTGESSLNYNGPDSADYNRNYTLKSTDKDNPWEDLIAVCDPLNNLPVEQLYDSLRTVLDIDRTLWFLAQEVVFSDDDSYINKGGSDYYVYWDEATGRLMPMEVDGNSVMTMQYVTWSPFYRETNTDYPLMNRLLRNAEIRQRYLAHLRTILAEHFLEQPIHDRIDEFAALLDQRVQDDPKKIYTYNEFLSGITDLKEFVTERIDFLSSFSEIDREGRAISDLTYAGSGDAPAAGAEAPFTVAVTGGTDRVYLYHGTGADGLFERTPMLDDGNHNDGAAGDGVYGATLPAHAAGTYVRYYVEAVADDAFGTATYFPAGAEHDVYIYRVEPNAVVLGDLVINELMADNDNVVQDAAGNYEDWVELYNNGTTTIDLSGYYLSDDAAELTKWAFPAGTTLAPDAYLIVWTDDDEDETSDAELHTNFKLSAGGEILTLSDADENVVDQVDFGEQETDVAYARSPNGTGDFVFQAATFGLNNETGTSVADTWAEEGMSLYPNPVSDVLYVRRDVVSGPSPTLRLYSATGRLLRSRVHPGGVLGMDVSGLPGGTYFLRVGTGGARAVSVVR